MLPELNENDWLNAIERAYGVRLGPGQIYADKRGRVYAGSEYVARLGVSASPRDAVEWSASICHFPRHTDTLETATRKELPNGA